MLCGPMSYTILYRLLCVALWLCGVRYWVLCCMLGSVVWRVLCGVCCVGRHHAATFTLCCVVCYVGDRHAPMLHVVWHMLCGWPLSANVARCVARVVWAAVTRQCCMLCGTCCVVGRHAPMWSGVMCCVGSRHTPMLHVVWCVVWVAVIHQRWVV